MEDLNKNISKNLQEIRRKRGLSLDKTSEITGVSKAMLGQIERGESNPTVTTLWKIASGLKISFSTLIETKKTAVSLVSQERMLPITADGGKYKVFSHFQFDPDKGFEIFNIVLEPGCSYQAEAHNPGVEEYLLVYENLLDLTVDNETYQIKAGGSLRFSADIPHVYSNKSESKTKAYVIIYYPS